MLIVAAKSHTGLVLFVSDLSIMAALLCCFSVLCIYDYFRYRLIFSAMSVMANGMQWRASTLNGDGAEI